MRRVPTDETPLKDYIVQQSYSGVATFCVRATSGKEALRIINREVDGEFIEAQSDTTKVNKAVYVRRDGPRKK